MKYNTLTNILDKIAKDAPKEFSKYQHGNDIEKNNQIRCKCYIHLFLMVRYGIDDFKEREKFITEGGYDGGIDAYYIDRENKTVYLIQSKFRNTEENFENKEISIDEIIKMDVGRILQGETKDEKGNDYNGKIKGFQRTHSQLPELGLYKRKVIFLCNLLSYTTQQIKRLIDNFEYEIFDFKKTYEKLVFPLLISTYYDVDYLDITINLDKKQAPHLNQEIKTQIGVFEITVVFVPTYEIGKIMSKYKNALLIFNPRNYLSLTKNDVNKKIQRSILDLNTGEFALFNNGITIFADSAGVNTASGRQNTGTVTMRKPQIINGGQTAFTLSKLYEDGIDKNRFEDKEVMLKIITPNYASSSATERLDKKIIKDISRSTNQQSKIEEADMRANDEIQVEIQKTLFNRFGLLYERKKGEFEEALRRGLIPKTLLIKREDLLKSYWSFKGEPGQAKNIKKDLLFGEAKFYDIIDSIDDIENIYLSILIFRKVSALEKKHKKTFSVDSKKMGYALKYGKNALIFMYSLVFKKDLNEDKIDKNIELLLNNWRKFENTFYKEAAGIPISNYYRNSTIKDKIIKYRKKMRENCA